MKLQKLDTLESLYEVMNVQKAHENTTTQFDLINLKDTVSNFKGSNMNL